MTSQCRSQNLTFDPIHDQPMTSFTMWSRRGHETIPGRVRLTFTLYCLFFLSQATRTGSTRCLRRAEIEDRPGNVYFCEDPERPACCEQDMTFKCCEEEWKIAMHGQIWTIVVICVSVAVILFLCNTARGQTQVFHRESASHAWSNFKDKISRKFSRNGSKSGRFDQIATENSSKT